MIQTGVASTGSRNKARNSRSCVSSAIVEWEGSYTAIGSTILNQALARLRTWRIYLSKTIGRTPLRIRISTHPRLAGQAPMIAIRLPVATMLDRSERNPLLKPRRLCTSQWRRLKPRRSHRSKCTRLRTDDPMGMRGRKPPRDCSCGGTCPRLRTGCLPQSALANWVYSCVPDTSIRSKECRSHDSGQPVASLSCDQTNHRFLGNPGFGLPQWSSLDPAGAPPGTA
jgi:hypothetical protein